MKLFLLSIGLGACLLTGCESNEAKQQARLKHLASLTCESSKQGRDKEELQAIADACFKGGSYHKSSGQQW